VRESDVSPFWGKALLGFGVVIIGFFLILSAFLNWYSSSGTMNLNVGGGASGFNISAPEQIGASFEISGVNIAANSQLKDVLTINMMGKKLKSDEIDQFFQQLQQGNPFNGSQGDGTRSVSRYTETEVAGLGYLPEQSSFNQVTSNDLSNRMFSSGSAWIRWVKTDSSGIVFFFTGLWPIAFGALLLLLGLMLLAPVKKIGIPIAVIGMLGFVVSLINIIEGYTKLGALTGSSYGMTVTNTVGIGLWLFLVFSVLAAAAGVVAAKYF